MSMSESLCFDNISEYVTWNGYLMIRHTCCNPQRRCANKRAMSDRRETVLCARGRDVEQSRTEQDDER